MHQMYSSITRPILNRFDFETRNLYARELLHLAESTSLGLRSIEHVTAQGKRFTDKRLQTTVAGIRFDNPLLLGAGWDKAGRAVRGLYTLGFAGVEVGTVVTHPQTGNPKPRQFIIHPGVVLNRTGFNSIGADKVAQNLIRYRESCIPIGISLGKNKMVKPKDAPEDHANVTEALYHDATYFVINVSSPNTPNLQKLQAKAPLADIVQAVNQTMDRMGKRKPTFIKISPELSNKAVDDVISVVQKNKLAGIIATNTTTNQELKMQYGKQWGKQAGGLSGDDAAFRKMTTEKITYIYKATGGTMHIIGVGGIHDSETALEKIRAGANLIQVVSAFCTEGPSLPGKINRGIVAYMKREGIKSLSEIVGSKSTPSFF